MIFYKEHTLCGRYGSRSREIKKASVINRLLLLVSCFIPISGIHLQSVSLLLSLTSQESSA